MSYNFKVLEQMLSFLHFFRFSFIFDGRLSWDYNLKLCPLVENLFVILFLCSMQVELELSGKEFVIFNVVFFLEFNEFYAHETNDNDQFQKRFQT